VRGFFLVFLLTLRQLLSRRRSIVLVLLALMPAGLGVLARFFAAPYPDTPFLTAVPILFVSFLVQITSLFYGSSVVRDAIEDRTATFILTTPTSRRAYLLGVYAALVADLLVLLELAVVATFLTWGAGVSGPFSGGEPFGPECLSLMLAVGVGVFVYSALFMLIGMYTRHSAVLGVVAYVLFDGFLASVPGPARRLAISAHLDALLDPRFVTRRTLSERMVEVAATTHIDVSLATIVLSIWFLIFMGTLLMRAGRHDFMDAGDTGK
jgi:ABC-2 type transport system permease protein